MQEKRMLRQIVKSVGSKKAKELLKTVIAERISKELEPKSIKTEKDDILRRLELLQDVVEKFPESVKFVDVATQGTSIHLNKRNDVIDVARVLGRQVVQTSRHDETYPWQWTVRYRNVEIFAIK